MTEPQGHSALLQSLLDEASPGDEAYERLIAHAWDRLLRLTRKMLRNYPHLRRWEQTEDVFQTAAIRLYRSLSEVRPATLPEFFGLAATQIRRTLIDLARHHFGPHGQAAHHHSDRGEEAPRREPSDSCRPETLLQWTEFHEAVERLPPAERDVFQMVWYGGLEQTEAARLLGVSVPTVQRRWYSAKSLLHEALHGESPASEESS